MRIKNLKLNREMDITIHSKAINFVGYHTLSKRKYESTKGMDKNLNLTEAQFTELRDNLIEGNETLFEKLFVHQFRKTETYLKNSLQADPDLIYDVVMNTMLEFRKRIIQGKVDYGNLSFLFTQMCKQRYQRQMGKKIDGDRLIASQSDDAAIDNELYELLELCVEKLGIQCQRIIKDFYYHQMGYADMADSYSKTSTALRKQKERCITQLKLLMKKAINKLS